MGLSINSRMNIVKWMATAKDDGKWDAREIRMLAEAAKYRHKDGYSKMGIRFATRLFNNEKTEYVHDADKQSLYQLLIDEMGIDPVKLTGADKAQDLQDFEALSTEGRFEFLKAASGNGFRLDEISTYEITSSVVRAVLNSKESDIYDWADTHYRERWDDLGWDDYTLEGALEDDYAGIGLEKVVKDGETYGYVLTWSYNQGEMGTAHYFDHQGNELGEADAGV